MEMRALINLVEANKRVMQTIGGVTIPTVNGYPEFGTGYWLPTSVLNFYDDPYAGRGDNGYTVSELKAEVEETGKIEMSIQVGLSIASGSDAVVVFNGNHRLAVARELNIPMMICDASDADDAEPLTVEQIVALGGKFI